MLTSLLTTLPFAVEKSRLICPTSIQREEGDDVTLQFHLDPPVNLVDYTLDVTRSDLDKEVCFYRDGKDNCGPQMDQYRDRTTLNHEGLTSGNITLQISSVQLNDSGPYTGFVPDLKVGCTTNLTVVKDQHNETMRGDPLTTIKPPTTDAEKVIVGAIVGGVLGIVVLAALIIGVLVYTGMIRPCGQREQEPEMAANRNEMEEINIEEAEEMI